jgi:hypothetical protein
MSGDHSLSFFVFSSLVLLSAMCRILTSAEKYVYGLCCSTGAQLICAYKYSTSGKGKKP